jgi:hypothetical protein
LKVESESASKVVVKVIVNPRFKLVASLVNGGLFESGIMLQEAGGIKIEV